MPLSRARGYQFTDSASLSHSCSANMADRHRLTIEQTYYMKVLSLAMVRTMPCSEDCGIFWFEDRPACTFLPRRPPPALDAREHTSRRMMCRLRSARSAEQAATIAVLSRSHSFIELLIGSYILTRVVGAEGEDQKTLAATSLGPVMRCLPRRPSKSIGPPRPSLAVACQSLRCRPASSRCLDPAALPDTVLPGCPVILPARPPSSPS